MTAAQIAEREAWCVQRSRFIGLMHRLVALKVLDSSTVRGESAWPAWTKFVAGAFREGLNDLHELDAAAFKVLNDEIAEHFFSGAKG